MPTSDVSESGAVAFGILLDDGATALDYALAANPDEDWQRCCMCGCAGDCASYDRLVTGLVLLADGSLARSAWCYVMRCDAERHQSTYIPWRSGSEQ